MLHIQKIGGPKREQPLHPDYSHGMFVAITHNRDGIKRCRQRPYKGIVELTDYLTEAFGKSGNVNLAYYMPGEDNNRPFFVQFYRNGIIYND